MLWIKSIHIIAMVAWFAGLFYLPRLFVYHAQTTHGPSIELFKTMERRLFFGIMTPAAVLTLVFGVWLWVGYGFTGTWLTLKLGLVALVVLHHIWCYRALTAFQNNANTKTHVYYRWMNELPVLLLIGIVLLVVFKPG